jgi:hypothetical protein
VITADEPMQRRNLRLMAERLRWPAGALDTCFTIEDAYPDWSAFWNEENTRPGFEYSACFSAIRHVPGARDFTVYAPDEKALREEIEQAPPPRW